MIKIFEEAARREGIRLEWRYITESPPDAVRSGAIQMWPAFPSERPPAEGLAVSRLGFNTFPVLLVQAESRMQSLSDLRGAAVGASDFPLDLAAPPWQLGESKLRAYPSARHAQEAFCRGEVEAVLLTYNRTIDFFLRRPGACQDPALRVIPLPGAGVGLWILAAPELRGVAERINARIGELAADGTFFSIAETQPLTASGPAMQAAGLARGLHRQSQLWYTLLGVILLLAVTGFLLAKSRREVLRRRGTEEQLRLQSEALEQSADAIIIIDMEGNYLAVNRAYAALHGYAREELAGKNFRLVHDEKTLREAVLPGIEAAVRNGSHSAMLAHRRKDGAGFPSLTSTTVLHSPDGKPVGLMAIVRDISREQRLEENLRQAQKLEAVGRLAGGLAHDFNNLLTVINGYSGLLLGEPGQSELVETGLREIGQAGEQGAQLTQQLLAFSRRQVLRPRVLDWNAVVRESQTMLRRLIGEHITVVIDLDPELGRVLADATAPAGAPEPGGERPRRHAGGRPASH